MSMRASLAVVLAVLLSSSAVVADPAGVTATEIRIGGVFPFSGPASSLGRVGQGIVAYVRSINDRGGVNGRKINYIALDDAYSPPKAVEQVRRLVESDDVAFIFSQLGTAGNAATARYLAMHGVPSVAIMSGSDRFTHVDAFPLTTTGLVSYGFEGTIYAKYLSKAMPTARYAVLYQNDDLGRDYLNAFRAFFKDAFAAKVATASFEVTDPTVDSQVIALKSSGAAALFVAGTPKTAAQVLRKVAELGWQPTIVLNFPSGSAPAALKAGGAGDKAMDILVGSIHKDPRDARWNDDEGMKAYRAFFAAYLPGADIADTNYLTGYAQGKILEQILMQCGNDLSRQNVARQARNLHDVVSPIALPGIRINTSAGSDMLWTQMQMQRWTGTNWEPSGDLLDAKAE